MELKSIYEYIDYRCYLSDYYTFFKKTDATFSYRKMAESMGFSSPNYVKLVIDGQRNIGKESLSKIIDSLGLKKKEAEYFSYLVFFSQAKNSIDKNYYFGLIAAFKSQSAITRINAEQFEFYNNWYNPIIRELIRGKREPVDYEKLAETISPPVSASKVKHAVELLNALGIIHLDKNGCYCHTASIMNTDNEVHSLALKNYHDSMISLAKDALYNVESSNREISSVTVNISASGYYRLKEKIQSFRTELLQIVQSDVDVDRIYQVNFQMFPVSKVYENEN